MTKNKKIWLFRWIDRQTMSDNISKIRYKWINELIFNYEYMNDKQFILCFAGPVVFPEPPADGPMESSGVIVGASGFGFVAPGSQQPQSKN